MDVEQPSKKNKMIFIAIILTAIFILASFGYIYLNGQPEAIVTFNPTEDSVSFECEVADTPSERAVGLMDREYLDPDEGMLFIFESPQNVSFWMKNTLIPLDIVFIDESGMIINIEKANPEPGINDADLIRYNSDRPVKWVLEINQDLCETYGITPGASVSIEFK